MGAAWSAICWQGVDADSRVISHTTKRKSGLIGCEDGVPQQRLRRSLQPRGVHGPIQGMKVVAGFRAAGPSIHQHSHQNSFTRLSNCTGRIFVARMLQRRRFGSESAAESNLSRFFTTKLEAGVTSNRPCAHLLFCVHQDFSVSAACSCTSNKSLCMHERSVLACSYVKSALKEP